MRKLNHKIRFSNFINTDSLKSRALKGGIWLGAGGAVEQALRLARNMLLARILAPDSFGVMAIILAINAALESFTQIGIKEAIIQNPKSEESTYLNGAWWLSFIRSIGLFILGVIGSVWLSDFYHIPHELNLLQLSFLGILFNGALSARSFIALKKMEFKKWVIISYGGSIIGLVISIVLSFLFHNVMALVIGFVAEAAARCLLSFIICPFLPRFDFADEHIRALFKYTRAMFGLPILYFIYAQAPIFVIGKMLAQSEVGTYSLAASLAQAPSLLVTVLMNQILMPIYSSRQLDKEWLNHNILRATKITVLFGFSICGFATLYARDLLMIVYGEQYAGVSIPFALLFMAAALATFSIPVVNCYLAVGEPRLHRLFLLIRAILVILFIYPATKLFSMTGAACVVLFSMSISYVFQIMRLRRLTGLNINKYVRNFLSGLCLTPIVLIIWFLTYDVFSHHPISNITLGLIGCSVMYSIIFLFNFPARKYLSRKESPV